MICPAVDALCRLEKTPPRTSRQSHVHVNERPTTERSGRDSRASGAGNYEKISRGRVSRTAGPVHPKRSCFRPPRIRTFVRLGQLPHVTYGLSVPSGPVVRTISDHRMSLSLLLLLLLLLFFSCSLVLVVHPVHSHAHKYPMVQDGSWFSLSLSLSLFLPSLPLCPISLVISSRSFPSSYLHSHCLFSISAKSKP